MLCYNRCPEVLKLVVAQYQVLSTYLVQSYEWPWLLEKLKQILHVMF